MSKKIRNGEILMPEGRRTRTRIRRRVRKSKLIMEIILIVGLLFAIPSSYGKYATTINRAIIVNIREPNYTVVFNSNDGNNNTVSQAFTYGTSASLTSNSFSRTNYIFKNWNTAAAGTGTSYSDGEVVNNLSAIDGDTVDLYAQWVSDFTITGNATAWTNQDVTLTVVLLAGNYYSDYDYSFDGGATWSSSNSAAISSNQNVHVKIRDHSGYVSAEKVESVTWIDKVAPTITYDNDTEYNADHSTKQVTTLIATLGDDINIFTGIHYSDDLSGVAGGWPKCYRGNNVITSTNYFTSVGRYAISCKVLDNAGNETTVGREVLIRWPRAGKYVVARQGYVGTGLSSTSSPNGLYLDTADTGADSSLPFASKYYYTGPTVDNYITFAGTTFRILNIPTNDGIKLLGEVSSGTVSWGDRSIYSSNVYNSWSTTWWPNGQLYNSSNNETRFKQLTATEQAHLDLATFYAGRFSSSNATNISSTINYERTGATNLGGNNNAAFQGYSAFPNVSDYLKASKAHDYVVSISDTQSTGGILGLGTNKRQLFNNNSWIGMSTSQWTMNSRDATILANDFWAIEVTGGNGRLYNTSYYNSRNYRVVFYLNNETILSGTGTQSDQFNVEEDWAWFDSYQAVQ